MALVAGVVDKRELKPGFAGENFAFSSRAAGGRDALESSAIDTLAGGGAAPTGSHLLLHVETLEAARGAERGPRGDRAGSEAGWTIRQGR